MNTIQNTAIQRTFYVPQTFESNYPALFQQANIPEPNSKQIQFYYLLLNTIRYNSILKLWSSKRKDYYYKFQYGNMNSRYLINLLGKHYKMYIANLQKMNIISCDGEYHKGVKSLGYCLADFIPSKGDAASLGDYETVNKYFVPVQISNLIINKRLSKIQVHTKKQKIQKRKQQKLLKLNPDYNKIIEHISTFFHNYNFETATDFVNGNLSDEKHKRAICYLNKIKNRDVDLQHSANGRLYSIITNIKKELLRFYSKQNFSSELIEVDLAAAQPTLLGAFFSKYNIPETTKVIAGKKYRWSDDAKNIYSILASLYNKFYNKNYSRDHLKKRLITFLNQSTFRNKQNSLYQILRQYYPSVLKLLAVIKATNHKNYAQELQGFEGELFIKQILIPFSKQHFIISKHDALIVRLEDYTYLQDLLYKTFTRHNIYDFHFKIKLLSSSKEICSDDIPTMLFTQLVGGEVAKSNKIDSIGIDFATMLKELNILNSIDYNAYQVA